MSNHWHIVIETPEGNLSQGMRQLNGMYTQYVNRTYKRVGHVYQGRYKAILVEKDSYLLELARYVVLNPVRANMVKAAGEWPWSSYGSMVGASTVPQWLQTDWVLGQFGHTLAEARLAYAAFVQAGIGGATPWNALRGQICLGSDAFVEAIKHQKERDQNLGEVPRAQRRMLAEPLAYYQQHYENRREGMAAAYATGDFTMKEIADVFGVHSTVSLAVKEFEMAAADRRG
jgi:hypothetical protein